MNEQAKEQVKVGVVHDPIFINSECGAVPIFGHELISDELVKALVGMFNMPEFAETDHGIFMVNFVDEDLRDMDNKPVLSLFYHDPRAIVVSMPNIWSKIVDELDAAIRGGQQNVPSIRLMAMFEVMFNIAHEIHHGMSYAAGEPIPKEKADIDVAEKAADDFADEFCTAVAKLVNVQLPNLDDEPYFGPMISEMFLNVAEDEKDPMVLKQKAALESGAAMLIWEGDEVKEQIATFREFLRKSSNDEEGWAEEPVNYGDDAVVRIRKALPVESPAPAAPAEEAKPAAESVAAPRVEAGPEVEEYDPLGGLTEAEMMEEIFGDAPEQQIAANVVAASHGDATATEAVRAEFGDGAVQHVQNNPPIGPAPAPVSNAAPTQPVAAAPAPSAAPVCEGPGGFPIVNAGGADTATAEEKAAMTYEVNGVDEDQVPVIMNQVYMALYQHIFANCRLMINGQQPFQNPDAVWQTPVDLKRIPGAQQLIVAADITDPNTGKYNSNQPVRDGMLLGNVKKHTRIPGYGLYLNVNGRCIRRTVLPQNPNTNGRYAPNARRGEAIMWVINEDVDRSHPHRWLILIENGKIRNVAAERRGR